MGLLKIGDILKSGGGDFYFKFTRKKKFIELLSFSLKITKAFHPLEVVESSFIHSDHMR